MTEKCRICLKKTYNLDCVNILNKLNEETTILQAIFTISSVQVFENDHLPQYICNQCYFKVDQSFMFRLLIISSDKKLREHLNNNLKETNETDSSDIHFYEKELENTCLENNHLVENDDSTLVESIDEIKIELNNDLLEKCDSTDIDVIDLPEEVSSRRKNIKITSKKCKMKNSNIEKKHECLDCEKSFKKADHLNIHIAYKHSEKKFKCDICNKKFARKYDLVYHNRVHTGERPFTCELCGKSFASSSYFGMHKKMHTGHRKMKCNFCPNSFINSEQLQIHERQKHTGERPFLCELCSHVFTNSSALFRHKKDVHGQKVECPLCKKFYSSRVLKDHVKRHKEREDGIKRFGCDLCGKRFTCATSRKRHFVIHSGEKAFKCEVCEKAFNQRSTLQTHMRVHSQVTPFQCDICSKNFKYKHHLKLHGERHHNSEGCLDNNTQLYEMKEDLI